MCSMSSRNEFFPSRLTALFRRAILVFAQQTKMCERYVPVAQLDRVSDSDSEGRAFESRRVYQWNPLKSLGNQGVLIILYRINL